MLELSLLERGAIELAPGRLDGIIEQLTSDDHSTFPCHKTLHCARGGEWNEEGEYSRLATSRCVPALPPI